MRIIGIAAVVLIILGIGTCAVVNRGDDTNYRSDTLSALSGLNNDASDQQVNDALVKSFGTNDGNEIGAVIAGTRSHGASLADVKSRLTTTDKSGKKDVLNTIDPSRVQVTASPTPAKTTSPGASPSPSPSPTGNLSEAKVREIAAEEAKKANSGLTEAQIRAIAEDAVKKATVAGGLTEAQIRNIVADAVKNAPTGLTEAQIRAIAEDAAKKAVSTTPGVTQDQIQKMIDKAVADAMAAIQKTGSLTEAQIRQIINDTLKSVGPVIAAGVPNNTTTVITQGGGMTTNTKCGPVTWGPAGPAPGVGTSDSAKQVNEAVQTMQVDLNSATHVTVHKFCPGDDTPNGWIVGSSWTEANRVVVKANYLKAGVCVDYDPNVTKVTGDVYHTQVLNPLWARTQIKSDGSASGLKFTAYWTPCAFTDGTPSWPGNGSVASTATPTPGSDSCPATAGDVATLTKTPATWAKLGNEPCAWLYSGTKVSFTVPSGYEVDYDAGGQAGKKRAGEAVPSGIVFTLRKLG